jgi:hypothetical protein
MRCFAKAAGRVRFSQSAPNREGSSSRESHKLTAPCATHGLTTTLLDSSMAERRSHTADTTVRFRLGRPSGFSSMEQSATVRRLKMGVRLPQAAPLLSCSSVAELRSDTPAMFEFRVLSVIASIRGRAHTRARGRSATSSTRRQTEVGTAVGRSKARASCTGRRAHAIHRTVCTERTEALSRQGGTSSAVEQRDCISWVVGSTPTFCPSGTSSAR